MNLKDIMTTDVKSCTIDTMLDSVAMMMWENDCGSIAVVDDKGTPIGMITDRDIAMGSALQHRPLWEMATSEITNNRPVFTCNENDDVHSLLTTMQNNKIRRVPVVDDEGHIDGIVSIGDLMAFAKKDAKSSGLSYDDTVNTCKAVSKPH